MSLTLDKKNHIYRYNRDVVPGTTQILDASGWLNFDAPYYTPEARRLGEVLHENCQFIDEDALDWKSVDPQVLPDVQNYREWRSKERIRTLFSEKPLYSNRYRYAGTPDFFLFIWKVAGACWIERGGLPAPQPAFN